MCLSRRLETVSHHQTKYSCSPQVSSGVTVHTNTIRFYSTVQFTETCKSYWLYNNMFVRDQVRYKNFNLIQWGEMCCTGTCPDWPHSKKGGTFQSKGNELKCMYYWKYCLFNVRNVKYQHLYSEIHSLTTILTHWNNHKQIVIQVAVKICLILYFIYDLCHFFQYLHKCK